MKIKLLDKNCMPYKKYQNDAGLDLRARIDGEIRFYPNMRMTIPTGVCIEIMPGLVGDIRPRSGLVKDLGLVAQYGTIDAGYTGEIGVTLINLSTQHVTIQPYERIAQLVIHPILIPEIEIVDDLEESDRGDKGFGSTGIK